MTVGLLVTILDDDGDKSTMTINLPDATTQASASTFANTLVPILDALTDGQIVEVGVFFALTLPAGIKTAPVANSDIQHKALFSFVSGGLYPTLLSIPAFNPNKFTPNSKVVNLADTDVITFKDMIVVGSGGVAPVDYRGIDVTGLRKAVEQFRR